MFTQVVLAETASVLRSVCKVPRQAIVDELIALVQKRNVVPFALDKSAVLEALLPCRPCARVSFADALLWAAVRATPESVVRTFDQRFPAEGVAVRNVT